MEEVYTAEELAAIMAVPCQTVWAWKRSGQIPQKSITPEGTFIKSIIDPLIELFKQNAPITPDSNQPQTIMPTEPKKSKPSAKKNYSPKVKKEAMRLIFEEKQTLEQAAATIGCSVGAIRQWKAKHQKSKKPASGAKTQKTPRQQPQGNTTSTPKKSSIGFDEFARQYWQEGTRAVDVLLLPPEIGPKIVNYVNEALRYAFDKLQGTS